MTRRNPSARRIALIGMTAGSTLLAASPALGAVNDDTREPAVSAAVGQGPAGARLTARTARVSGFSTAAMARTLTSTASHSAYLGSSLSGVVVDPATGAVTWSYRGGTRRIPASTQKLLTAYTILHSLNPDTTFATQAMQAPNGAVFLKGGGDPSLSYGRIKQLAATTAQSLHQAGRTTVSLYADATYFPLSPTKAVGWRSDTVGSDAQYVRGLALAGYRGQGDSSLAATKAFATYLGQAGIRATVTGKAATPARSWAVASTDSAPVRSLVATMLNVSANDYAEFMLRQAARAKGISTGWYGAGVIMRRTLAAGGIPTARLATYDGSGLSRANRMPLETMSAVIQRLWNNPADKAVVFGWNGVPRSGQTGTLNHRFNQSGTSCARGQVIAKTGTLKGVVGLAGVVMSVDGRPRVFALLENGQPRNTPVRRAVDNLATTMVGCR